MAAGLLRRCQRIVAADREYRNCPCFAAAPTLHRPAAILISNATAGGSGFHPIDVALLISHDVRSKPDA